MIDIKNPKEIQEFFIHVSFSRKIIKIEIVESVKDEKYQSVNGRNRHVMLIFRKLEMRQRFPRVTYFSSLPFSHMFTARNGLSSFPRGSLFACRTKHFTV